MNTQQTQHQDALNDLPRFQDQIYDLKKDPHFRRLFTEYQRLASLVENLENAEVHASHSQENDYRYRKIRLKDELIQMIKDKSDGA